MDWQLGIRSPGLGSWARDRAIAEAYVARQGWSGAAWASLAIGLFPMLLLLFAVSLPLAGREKNKSTYGEGLTVSIPLPESEVEQVVVEVTQNGLIRGTKEYNKDEFVAGAKPATSCSIFPPWDQGGKVFYKIREQAIDPRNFKDSGDVGTIGVRYVVLAQGEKNTVLRIDALFKEDFRHTVHPSNGSVESSEYKDIHEHIEAIEIVKSQTVEAQKEQQEQREKKQRAAMETYAPTMTEPPQTAPPAVAQAIPQAVESQTDPASQASATESPTGQSLSSQSVPGQALPGQTAPGQTMPGQSVPGQSLEEHVKDLRKQVERLVKAPGAPLKSAPFHTASTLQSLTTGTEVLILISTPYWYGVETHEGQHGWILRDDLVQP